jgi:hypothetical protein
LPSSCSVEYDGGFTFLKPSSIECRIVTCQHWETCSSVGKSQGILPIANSIFSVLGLDWELPGQGSAYADCGDWRYRGCLRVDAHNQNELEKSVEGKIYVEYYHRSCYRAECPTCYEKWAAKIARSGAHRLKHIWKHGKVCHFVVSPPEKDVLNLPYEKLRSKAVLIAQSRGIRGGALIFHHLRVNSDGTWRFAPHFHIVGYGWVKNTAEMYGKDGYLVKKIPDGKNPRSPYQTLFYQLSHCAVDRNRKRRTLTWFGVCSTAGKNHVVVPPMEKEKHLCPCCGEELVQLRYFGDPDKLSDREVGGSAWLDPEDWIEKETTEWRG